MATSQNGYSADDRSVIRSYTIPGTSERVALRKGDASVVLLDLAGFIHAEVVDIEQPTLDEWGFAERTIRGSSTELSNHASGTAIDIDARKHPLGVQGTWTAVQKRQIHARLSLYNGVVRWGEDYSGRVDGMHFEINKGKDALSRIAGRIRSGQLGNGALSYLVGRKPFAAEPDHHDPKPPVPEWFHREIRLRLTQPYMHGADVFRVQAILGITGKARDGIFGPRTSSEIKHFQRRHGLVDDGVVGPRTARALGH